MVQPRRTRDSEQLESLMHNNASATATTTTRSTDNVTACQSIPMAAWRGFVWSVIFYLCTVHAAMLYRSRWNNTSILLEDGDNSVLLEEIHSLLPINTTTTATSNVKSSSTTLSTAKYQELLQLSTSMFEKITATNDNLHDESLANIRQELKSMMLTKKRNENIAATSLLHQQQQLNNKDHFNTKLKATQELLELVNYKKSKTGNFNYNVEEELVPNNKEENNNILSLIHAAMDEINNYDNRKKDIIMPTITSANKVDDEEEGRNHGTEKDIINSLSINNNNMFVNNLQLVIDQSMERTIENSNEKIFFWDICNNVNNVGLNTKSHVEEENDKKLLFATSNDINQMISFFKDFIANWGHTLLSNPNDQQEILVNVRDQIRAKVHQKQRIKAELFVEHERRLAQKVHAGKNSDYENNGQIGDINSCVNIEMLGEMISCGLEAAVYKHQSISDAVRQQIVIDNDKNDEDNMNGVKGDEMIEHKEWVDILSPLTHLSRFNGILSSLLPISSSWNNQALTHASTGRRHTINMLQRIDSYKLHSSLKSLDGVADDYILGHFSLVDSILDGIMDLDPRSSSSSLPNAPSSTSIGGSIHGAIIHMLACIPDPTLIFTSMTKHFSSQYDNTVGGSDGKYNGWAQRFKPIVEVMYSIHNKLPRQIRNSVQSIRWYCYFLYRKANAISEDSHLRKLGLVKSLIGHTSTDGGILLPLCWSNVKQQMTDRGVTLVFDLMQANGKRMIVEDDEEETGEGRIEIDRVQVSHVNTLAGEGSPWTPAVLPDFVDISVLSGNGSEVSLGVYELRASNYDGNTDDNVLDFALRQNNATIAASRITMKFVSTAVESGNATALICIGGLKVFGRVV